MIKKIIVTSLLIAVAIVNAVTVHAAFEDTYWGVRALGMGGAFTAVANDSNSQLYNIAGTAEIPEKEITLMSSRLFTGLEGVEITANYFGFVYPLDEQYGTLSWTWSSLGVPGLVRYDTFSAGYARTLNDILCIDTEVLSLSAGINLKYLRQDINFEKEYEPNNVKGGIAADIGLLATFTNGISLGYSSKYIAAPDLGYDEKDEVSNMNVIGVAYYSEELPYLRLPYFTIDADIIFLDDEITVRLGAETYIIDGKLAIRAGGRQEAVNIGFGYEIAFGEHRLIIDYALEYPLEIEESMGSHFISLSFRF